MKRFALLLFPATIAFFALVFSSPSSAQAQAISTPTHGPLPPGMEVVQAASVWTVIHAQTFEGAFPAPGWSVTDLSNDGYQRFWDDSNYRFHLGTWAAWPANGGANLREPIAGNENYFNSMNTRMVYGPFSLVGATSADTDFYLWLDSEATYDYLAFEVSHDGVTFQEKARWSGSAASWQFKDIYYNDYVGDSSVWVAWRFYSDTSVTRRGPWVDDIRIWKYAPAPTPTRTLSPTITKTRTKSPTPTISPTRTKTPTVTKSPTETRTRTATQTPTRTKTPTVTKTRTPKPTSTRTRTRTPCPLSACTATPTKTKTRTLTPTKTKTRTPTVTPTPTGYRRYDAVNYADTWAHGRNPDFPLLAVAGNETGCDCDNCTNFASQVLHAGGRAFQGEYLIHRQWPQDWWFDLSYTQLTSPVTWRNVEDFKKHAEAYPNEFDVSSKTTDPNLPANITAGDFILLDLGNNDTGINIPDNRPDHVRVIVGEGWTSTSVIDYYDECVNSTPAPTPTAVPTSVFKMLIDQHCVDRYHVGWNYGIAENANKWYIHVK